jgi:enamine deaminase RidA (YjgF/YER057c/UK114 family)
MSVTRVSSASRSTPAIACSSAVRAGDLVVLSGVDAGADDENGVAPVDPYDQATVCLRKVVAALSELGADVSDVVHSRIYLSDANHWPAVARAHREVFEHSRPAVTIVVARLLDPRMLVDIEVTAYVAK